MSMRARNLFYLFAAAHGETHWHTLQQLRASTRNIRRSPLFRPDETVHVTALKKGQVEESNDGNGRNVHISNKVAFGAVYLRVDFLMNLAIQSPARM